MTALEEGRYVSKTEITKIIEKPSKTFQDFWFGIQSAKNTTHNDNQPLEELPLLEMEYRRNKATELICVAAERRQSVKIYTRTKAVLGDYSCSHMAMIQWWNTFP